MIFEFEKEMLDNYKYASMNLQEAIANGNAWEVAYFDGFRRCAVDTLTWIREVQTPLISDQLAKIDTVNPSLFDATTIPAVDASTMINN